MEVGQQVRFTRSGPHGEWDKGSYGTISSVLVERPQATSDIYLIKLFDDQVVWATHEDIQISQGEQLTLC